MNRIDRLTAILIQLQGKPRIPMEDFEERFGVSRRTIFRDLKSLMEAGVPIGGDAGEGYFIVDGYHLPPVVFNKEEAAALLLGAKLIEQNADSQIAKNFQEAMYKIKAVLKCHDREFLDTLEQSISVIASPTVSNFGFPDSHIAEIQMALAARKIIRIRYHSNYKDQTTDRKVAPLGLVYYSSRWHLIGYCHLREDLRDFRTDRIQSLNILSDNYHPEDHPNYLEFLQRMIGGTDANEATIRFSKKVTRFIQDQKYHYGFVEEHAEGDVVEMKFITPHYEYLARWLLMFIEEATVVSPPKLQGLVASYSQGLITHHQKYFTS